MIQKKIINENIFSIQKYFINIDEDIFIDYLCFFFEDKIICTTIDSSGESISIINFEEMKEDIKKTDIKYIVEEIEKDIFLKEMYYKYDKYEQLQKIDFIFDKKILEVIVSLDAIRYKYLL